MKKVYCKNCQRIRWGCQCEIPIVDDTHKETKEFQYIEVPNRCEGHAITDRINHNKEGNCPYYKRKWWKFWKRT